MKALYSKRSNSLFSIALYFTLAALKLLNFKQVFSKYLKIKFCQYTKYIYFLKIMLIFWKTLCAQTKIMQNFINTAVHNCTFKLLYS